MGQIALGDTNSLTNSDVLHLNPRWDEMTCCSNLIQIYNFDNYTNAGDLSHTLHQLGITESEHLIKTGTKANIDYALITITPEKQNGIVSVLQQHHPTMAAAAVIPTRRLQDKPAVVIKRTQATTINPEAAVQISSLTKKVDTLTTLIKILNSEVQELKKKHEATNRENPQEDAEQDDDMETSENTNDEKSSSSENPNTSLEKIDQDQTQRPIPSKVNLTNTESPKTNNLSTSHNPPVHNTRARTAARKDELQKSSSKGRAEKRLKTNN